MGRAILFFLLLAAGLLLLYSVWQAEQRGFTVNFPAVARPSTRPLPVPWQNSPPLTVHGLDAAQREAAPGAAQQGPGACGARYTVQPGDTLGAIARACGVSLDGVLAANPSISNPNRIEVGQELAIPVVAGRGGGDPLAVQITGGQALAPGSSVTIQVGGLPADTPVKIGLGLSDEGFRVLGQSQTDASGALDVTVTIPPDVARGQRAFFLVTSQSVPTRQAISAKFVVE